MPANTLIAYLICRVKSKVTETRRPISTSSARGGRRFICRMVREVVLTKRTEAEGDQSEADERDDKEKTGGDDKSGGKEKKVLKQNSSVEESQCYERTRHIVWPRAAYVSVILDRRTDLGPGASLIFEGARKTVSLSKKDLPDEEAVKTLNTRSAPSGTGADKANNLLFTGDHVKLHFASRLPHGSRRTLIIGALLLRSQERGSIR